VEQEGGDRGTGSEGRGEAPGRKASELPSRDRAPKPAITRTPLFVAQHSERYARQAIIREYEELTGASLIVVIDALFDHSVTLLEELLSVASKDRPLHLMLSSPGGDGEVAVRLVRALQARCSELTVIVPDMAKSAATILCLGADRILMSPSSDLGPVDPQFRVGDRLVGAKEIERAVANADERVQAAPDTYPLYAGLLADVNMLMVEQARSQMDRSYDLLKESLICSGRDAAASVELANRLKGPLVDEAMTHSATVGPVHAQDLGLPVEVADLDGREWQLIWELWTRYFALGAWPAGNKFIYEGNRASQISG
jgi:hypothetical protein